MARITLAGSDQAFDCAGDDTILRAGLRAGLALPYSCNTGSCGTCRFELVDGEVEHLRDDPPAWSERDRKRNRWLGCQARALGPCTIKVRLDPEGQGESPPVAMTGRLERVTRLTDDMSEFAFAVSGPDRFQPGQYALVTAPGVAAPRAYSMCNLPGEGVWSFQIKRVPGGEATTSLFNRLDTGDEVAIDGPYGTAWLREDIDRDILLMAGGSGLSPMISIVRAAANSKALVGRRIHFFYGCRHPHELAGEDIVAALPGFGERITWTAAVSDPADDDRWSGPTGFVHEVARERFGDALKEFEIYFAGPAAMAAAIQMMMHEAEIDPAHVHFDEFY